MMPSSLAHHSLSLSAAAARALSPSRKMVAHRHARPTRRSLLSLDGLFWEVAANAMSSGVVPTVRARGPICWSALQWVVGQSEV